MHPVHEFQLQQTRRQFFGDAGLRLSEQQPHGMVAEVEFPAREAMA